MWIVWTSNEWPQACATLPAALAECERRWPGCEGTFARGRSIVVYPDDENFWQPCAIVQRNFDPAALAVATGQETVNATGGDRRQNAENVKGNTMGILTKVANVAQRMIGGQSADLEQKRAAWKALLADLPHRQAALRAAFEELGRVKQRIQAGDASPVKFELAEQALAAASARVAESRQAHCELVGSAPRPLQRELRTLLASKKTIGDRRSRIEQRLGELVDELRAAKGRIEGTQAAQRREGPVAQIMQEAARAQETLDLIDEERPQLEGEIAALLEEQEQLKIAIGAHKQRMVEA